MNKIINKISLKILTLWVSLTSMPVWADINLPDPDETGADASWDFYDLFQWGAQIIISAVILILVGQTIFTMASGANDEMEKAKNNQGSMTDVVKFIGVGVLVLVVIIVIGGLIYDMVS